MGKADPNVKRRSTLATVPSGEDAVTTSLAVVPSFGIATFAVTTIPDDDTLNLWDFLWSVFINTNDVAHLWPSGASLDPEDVRNIYIFAHTDWATSSDSTNQRRVLITVMNNTFNPITAYLAFKAYTIAGSAGA